MFKPKIAKVGPTLEIMTGTESAEVGNLIRPTLRHLNKAERFALIAVKRWNDEVCILSFDRCTSLYNSAPEYIRNTVSPSASTKIFQTRKREGCLYKGSSLRFTKGIYAHQGW